MLVPEAMSVLVPQPIRAMADIDWMFIDIVDSSCSRIALNCFIKSGSSVSEITSQAK